MSAVPTVYAVLAACPVTGRTSARCAARWSARPRSPRGYAPASRRRLGFRCSKGTDSPRRPAPARGLLEVRRPGSAGQRLPYQNIRTADGERDLPLGTVGSVLISGPTVFPGYVEGRDADGHRIGQGRVADGRLGTGDLGHLDEDGFLHLTGGAQDLIIRGGHNIAPPGSSRTRCSRTPR